MVKKEIVHLIFVFTTCASTSLFAQSFTKITSGPVVNTIGDSRSVNWIDVNNDDLLDLMITNGPAGGQNNFLYLNDGAGGFTAVVNDTIVKDGKPSDGATWADTDNDGDLDCFVANWYNFIGLYYNNNGNGTFNYNAAAGLTTGITYSETASWGDYDKDGFVDLYVARSGGTVATNRNFLFHNNGNNTFTKITSGSLVTDALVSRSVNWTDADNDGDLDLFVSNEDVTNNDENFYRNDGNGAFTKLSTGDLLNDGKKTMSSSWADFDNDGDLDVFLANEDATNALFRNDGNFNFTKLINDTVTKGIANSFSSAWSDVDNDGDVDLFVTNSFKTNTKMPCLFYLNNGNATFTRISNHTLTADSGWTYGCAFGDYDNDGFEDLAVATVRYQSQDKPDLLFHNNANSNNWLTLKLIGTTTNKSAIGTKVRVKAQINGTPVWQMREISSQSSYCGQNDMRAHFGLGNATLIDSLKIEWLSGLVQVFDSVPLNEFITITEGQVSIGISEKEKASDMILFPNPSKGIITLSNIRLSEGDLILISNSKGDTLSKIDIKSAVTRFEIDLKKQGCKSGGNYYITVQSKNGSITKKIVKL